MDDAEVNLPDLVAVVVDQGGDAIGVRRVENELFVQLALDRGEVGVAAGAAAAGIDRIDVTAEGRARIYDYKTGTPPSKAQQRAFDEQLPLLATMAERGAFGDLGPVEVAKASYVIIGAHSDVKDWQLDQPLDEIWQGFERLFAAWLEDGRGYVPRRAMERKGFASDYDLISRYGEWDLSDPALTVKVGR